jgi:hypothetical protein
MTLSTEHDMASTILAGPLLRRISAERLVFWLASREPVRFRLLLDGRAPLALDGERQQQLRVGEHCFIQLLDLALEQPLPADTLIPYDLQWRREGENDWHGLADWAPDLGYGEGELPSLVVRGRLDGILHGSCRKPHHAASDGLVAADAWLRQCRERPLERPAVLMLSGDQVYADDVAGPMLTAIHQLIEELGLYPETLEGALVADSAELFASPQNYYRRHELLPDSRANLPLRERFFEGARKPIFTTDSAHNHLITLAEVLAMYLLVWSPGPLAPGLDLETRPWLTGGAARCTTRSGPAIVAFVAELPAVRRLLAHLPTAMIFDDHDITDDWNLSREWEETAYGHPFSRRIIGNALIGYLINQGWGNRSGRLCGRAHGPAHPGRAAGGRAARRLHRSSAALRALALRLDTSPRLLVLDTRTRRWRSSGGFGSPSGLMDWEALTELQQTAAARTPC